MKKKTINSIICKKFDEWVETITDEQVKTLVKKSTIITGGCIASMLLKEQVNDFDVYFTNKETAIAVAKYYVNKFKGDNEVAFKDSGKEVKIWVEYDDDADRVKIHIKSAGIASEGSGSNYQYFETRPPQETEDYVEQVVRDVSEVDEKVIDETSKERYRPVFFSANAITLSNKIQIIVRFFGAPTEIHSNYDFIHTTNYWLSENRQVYLNSDALESLLSRELVYVGSKYPLCSIIRTRKFLKRGFTINAGQYLKMCFQVSHLDLENIQVLEDQLIGVDAAYFGQLVDALKDHKEKNPEFKLEYGYLATIIDKIF
jgi:hypothetical protein